MLIFGVLYQLLTFKQMENLTLVEKNKKTSKTKNAFATFKRLSLNKPVIRTFL